MRSEFTDIVRKLTKIYSEPEARSITFILFEDLFNITKAEIFTSDCLLNSAQKTKLTEAVTLLLNHTPVQYVTGRAWFSGLKFKVNSSVLIPRQETEELVNLICKYNLIESPTILDICTGSGCIALALKNGLKDALIYASDISLSALEIANENAILNKLDVRFVENDILNSQAWSAFDIKFDIIVSNPPYISLSEKESMPKNVKDFEPELALFVSDSDPLIFYKAIADFSLKKLKSGGSLYFEINEKYGEELISILDYKGFSCLELIKDLNGKQRIIKSRLVEEE